jgi:hypothetical protein
MLSLDSAKTKFGILGFLILVLLNFAINYYFFADAWDSFERRYKSNSISKGYCSGRSIRIKGKFDDREVNYGSGNTMIICFESAGLIIKNNHPVFSLDRKEILIPWSEIYDVEYTDHVANTYRLFLKGFSGWIDISLTAGGSKKEPSACQAFVKAAGKAWHGSFSYNNCD